MSVTNPSKVIAPAGFACGDTATVTIGFDAAAELSANPADIVLIMDRSGSMTQDRLIAAKAAARQMIARVAGASGGTQAGPLANGSRMGLVSFADTASADLALSADVGALDAAVDALARGGLTNHRAAFETAEQMFDPQSASRKVAVMFTDGVTTVGGDAQPVADRMKAAGIEIFCIGLLSDPAPLNGWASDPDSIHVAFTDDLAQLDRVFGEITAEVVLAGAMDVQIQEMLNPEFRLVRIHAPSHGTARPVGQQGLEWSVDAVGLDAAATRASLSFDIRYTGSESGVYPVNASLTYQDRSGSVLAFPEPRADVDCSGAVIYPEPCPAPAYFRAEGCEDAVNIDLPAVGLSSLGRIVQADVTVRNVCPGKRVAVAVLLTEEGPDGEEYPRGQKSLLIPALDGETCRDVTLRCIRFVVPEALDATGSQDSLCNARTFQARVMANYVDTDFVCCDASTVSL